MRTRDGSQPLTVSFTNPTDRRSFWLAMSKRKWNDNMNWARSLATDLFGASPTNHDLIETEINGARSLKQFQSFSSVDSVKTLHTCFTDSFYARNWFDVNLVSESRFYFAVIKSNKQQLLEQHSVLCLNRISQLSASAVYGLLPLFSRLCSLPLHC